MLRNKVMDREQLKYGTDHTSVKVKQVPGGTSSISLGWEPQQRSKYSKPAQSKQDYSNYESRGQKYEDDYYAPQAKSQPRGGSKWNNYEEDYSGDRKQGYNAKQTDDYGRGDSYKNSRANDDYDDYSYDDPYSRDTQSRDTYSKDTYSSDPYSRDTYSKDPYSKSSNQGRGDGGRYQDSYSRNEGYGRNQDTYARAGDSYARGGDVYERGGDSYGRGGDSYGRGGDSYGRGGDTYGRGGDTYGRDAANNRAKGYNDTGYDRGYSSKDPYNDRDYSNKDYPTRDYPSSNYDRDSSSQNSRRADPAYEDYDSRSYKQNDRRTYDDEVPGSKGKAKTSVKVKNPPGGQSSFIFG